MSQQILHLANPDDMDRLISMVSRCHEEMGLETGEEERRAAMLPLLEGNPQGAIWLIGPRMSPVGYVCVSFGWSLELGGMDGTIVEFWVRDKVRGRGMGSEALLALQKALAGAGVRALHLEARGDTAERICRRAGFRRKPAPLMTWIAG
ncbi:MAG: GNAT family N-acetyltransferase [Silicimonas sp.]|nr:GNAT family N-acetyltransferase [Silicimonas sp.]